MCPAASRPLCLCATSFPAVAIVCAFRVLEPASPHLLLRMFPQLFVQFLEDKQLKSFFDRWRRWTSRIQVFIDKWAKQRCVPLHPSPTTGFAIVYTVVVRHLMYLAPPHCFFRARCLATRTFRCWS